jgi:hypothetical protein
MMVVGVGNETEKGKVMTKILFGVSNCDIGLEQKNSVFNEMAQYDIEMSLKFGGFKIIHF